MGTAKYDHPGYVADTGDAGKYHVGIWCPHGYPAHIHIGRPADGGDPLALLRLRIPDGVFQSLADDPETLCRRALGQALGAGCCAPWRWTATTRRSVSNSTPSPGWPHAGGAGLTSCPQRLWKSLGIAAVHV